MKIADLFVQLGFKVDGGDDLNKVDQRLTKANVSALGLLAGVTALNAAFYAMIRRGAEAAVSLDMFDKATGRGTDSVQRLEAGAARSNVAAGTVTAAIKNIQKTAAEIALGNVDASSPWFILGIDPREDPVKVVDSLREALARLDPAIARTLAARMGFGDEFLYFLQQSKKEGGVIVSPEEIARLTALSSAWRGLVFNVGAVATKFAAAFAEGLSKVAMWLEKGVFLLERFVRWLNGTTSVASAARGALLAVVGVLGFLGIALAGIVALMAVLKAAFIAIQLVPIVAALTAFVAVLALMAGAFVGLILLIEDFWTQIDGGQSLFDWNENLIFTIKNVERLASAIQSVLEFWNQLKGNVGLQRTFSAEMLKTGLSYGSGVGFIRDFVNWNWRSNAGSGGGGGPTTINVEQNIDGAGDPKSVADYSNRLLAGAMSDVLGQMPVATN